MTVRVRFYYGKPKRLHDGSFTTRVMEDIKTYDDIFAALKACKDPGAYVIRTELLDDDAPSLRRP